MLPNERAFDRKLSNFSGNLIMGKLLMERNGSTLDESLKKQGLLGIISFNKDVANNKSPKCYSY